MDNVTHSLIGVALARLAAPRFVPLRPALWAAVLGSNLPDIDVLAPPLFDDPGLAYVLHHRGHTHTALVAAITGAALGAAVGWRSPGERARLAGLGAAAALGHIAADALNNYGVHPWWPWDSSWRWGDSLFIVEPALWMLLGPLAFARADGAWRWLGAALGAGGLIACAANLGAAAAAAWALGVAAMVVDQRRHDDPIAPIALTLVFTAGMGILPGLVTAGVQIVAIPRFRAHVVDVAAMPRPFTPWCWQGWVTTVDNDGAYAARAWTLTLWPSRWSPADCALRLDVTRTAPLTRSTAETGRGAEFVAWGDAFVAPLSELRALTEDHCRVEAFTRFARVPFWKREGDGWIIGDLRYDFEPGLGFAEIEVLGPDDRRGCDNVPPWRSPVMDELLDAAPRR